MRKNDRWFHRIVRDSKTNDLKKRTIDPDIPYIDAEFLKNLQTTQKNRCYYCQTFLNWIERRSCKQGLTVERMDNSLPHYKTNCTLACKSCHSKVFSREQGLMKRYFSKWKHKTFDLKVPQYERSASFLN